MRLKAIVPAIVFSVQMLWAVPPNPVVINAVVDQYRPIPFDNGKLIGLFAARMRANSEGFLEAAPEHTTPQAASEFLGVASYAFEYRHDAQLKLLLDRAAAVLLAPSTASDAQDYLPGLLAYYRVTGADAALARSRQITDSVVSKNPDLNEVPLIDSLVVLFRYTGESRYIDFAKSLANRALKAKEWSGSETDPAILTRKLHLAAALVDLYRITGDENYLQPATACWRNTAARNLTLTGAIKITDTDRAPAPACATVAWMQLSLELLRITGSPSYASELEKTIYNQLFAGQDLRTGQVCSAVPLNGTKAWSSERAACEWAQSLGITQLPAITWGRYGNGIAVNLYTGGRATLRLRRRGTVQIYSEASFPDNGQILLHVEPDHNLQFPLRLRVPEWTSSFMAEFAGSRIAGKPGQYLTISRQWQRGDTVKIHIDLTTQLIPGSGESTGDFAVKRGPQVLALGVTLNPDVKNLSDAAIVLSSPSPVLFSKEGSFPANWAADQAYSTDGEYGNQPLRLTLVPFADARTYRLFLRRSAHSPSTALP